MRFTVHKFSECEMLLLIQISRPTKGRTMRDETLAAATRYSTPYWVPKSVCSTVTSMLNVPKGGQDGPGDDGGGIGGARGRGGLGSGPDGVGEGLGAGGEGTGGGGGKKGEGGDGGAHPTCWERLNSPLEASQTQQNRRIGTN